MQVEFEPPPRPAEPPPVPEPPADVLPRDRRNAIFLPAIRGSQTTNPITPGPAETPEQVTATLWGLLGQRELLWKKSKVELEVGKQIAKLAQEIKGELPNRTGPRSGASSVRRLAESLGMSPDFADILEAPNTDLATVFLEEVGLGAVPILGTIASAASMVKEATKAGNTALNQWFVGRRRMSARTAYVKSGAESLIVVLDAKFKTEMTRLGTYAGETAAGVFVPGVAAIPAAAVRLLRRLYVLYEDYKMVRKANEVLRDEARFQTDCLVDFPILGCHTIVELRESVLEGVIAGHEMDSLTPEQRTRKITTYVQAAGSKRAESQWKFWSDKTVLEDRFEKIIRLRKLATQIIASAPYELTPAPGRRAGND